ncbi:DUF1493 family protein [Mucilaginibacter sp.]|uniref:DUF1493 family protein n=1 Tax=Mucilaginibacter sp. TaxID=1882438 RepID=UPI003D133A17
MSRKLFIQMEEIHPQLKEFIVDYCTRYKIQKVDPHSLSLDTSIDLDLDIADIEIDLFLAEFAEKFRIDQSKFSWYKYGYPTGSASVKVIKAVFGYKSTWVKRLSHRLYKPKFRVSNLQDAVMTGKLL